jgi:hypothetical protein
MRKASADMADTCRETAGAYQQVIEAWEET